MFSHLTKYMSAIMYKNREGVSFGLIFPLLFGIIYLIVFTGLMSGGNKIDSIPVAVVFEGTTAEKLSARDIFNNIATPGEVENHIVVAQDKSLTNSIEDALLTYIEATPAEAHELVDHNKVDAIISIDNTANQLNISLEVAPASVNRYSSSIIYSALSSLSTTNTGVKTLITSSLASVELLSSLSSIDERLTILSNHPPYTVDDNTAKGTSSYSLYFYACIAYLCLFFMGMGMDMVTHNEANYSLQALRATLSPIPKYKRFFASFVSWSIPSLMIMYTLIIIFYQNNVPLGNDWLRIILVVTLGVLVGLLLGSAIASVIKPSQSTLNAISIALPLTLGALSGLMSQEIKIMINENIPWLNKINPISLISDAIYYLNNYPTLKQYNQNILILIAFAVILFGITVISLRRTDYETL